LFYKWLFFSAKSQLKYDMLPRFVMWIKRVQKNREAQKFCRKKEIPAPEVQKKSREKIGICMFFTKAQLCCN